MRLGAVKALEFDRVVDALCSFAITPFGASLLAKLRPDVDVRRVEEMLASTTEGVEYLQSEKLFPLSTPIDLEQTLNSLAVEGRALKPKQLLELNDHLDSIQATCSKICQTDRVRFPMLFDIAESCESFVDESNEVHKKIDASGNVVDDASPKLRMMRKQLLQQRNRLQTTLESYIRGKGTSHYLQEKIVSDRDGRYVLLVKSEHRTAIPGIVHGTSTSGASLFLEPLSTVEVNNEIRSRQEQIAEEIHRILLSLSNLFRKRALDLRRMIAIATKLDVIQAKARLSELMDGTKPKISTDGRLELLGARHPLLISAVIKRLSQEMVEPQPEHNCKTVVPVNISVIPPDTTLVITGPNTGGKTVALKTVGLLALMVQAGLRIPVTQGSSLPLFGSMFSDIGDEQSIADSLSTFSAHIKNIATMDRNLVLPSLVLLDEVGAGTDPMEGGALGMAIIEHFRQRKALIIATTHYDVLKSYATTTEGVTVAGFGFDEGTFEPTYHLSYGSPGRSLAIEIASRLGLPASVIKAAKNARGARETQLETHLARIEDDVTALQKKRGQAADNEARLLALESTLSEREKRIFEREKSLSIKYEDQLLSYLQKAKQDIDVIVDDVKHQGEALVSEVAHRTTHGQASLSTGETGEMRTSANDQLSSLAESIKHLGFNAERHKSSLKKKTSDTDLGSVTSLPTVGKKVLIRSLGLDGVVRKLSGPDAEVEVEGKRLHVAASELENISETETNPSVTVGLQLQPRLTRPDLNVIGCTVDEALSQTEKFLNDAVLTEQSTVRIIHGHGSGKLRRAITDLLHDHPLVNRFETASPNEGGGKVTVVELKE